jgi:opacity protein-like surface antigen
MKLRLITAVAAAMAVSAPAFADTKPSADEVKRLTEAAAALGFTGGQPEKETEGSGVFEIDDAKSKDGGQYDLKFDKDFKLLSATRD